MDLVLSLRKVMHRNKHQIHPDDIKKLEICFNYAFMIRSFPGIARDNINEILDIFMKINKRRVTPMFDLTNLMQRLDIH